MAQKERTHARDLTYSAWHRTDSIARFVGRYSAAKMLMYDIDGAEFDGGRCVGLVEVGRDVGQTEKGRAHILDLAQRAQVPGIIALYTPGETPNPADSLVPDIVSFRWHDVEHPGEWQHASPQEFAELLDALRA